MLPHSRLGHEQQHDKQQVKKRLHENARSAEYLLSRAARHPGLGFLVPSAGRKERHETGSDCSTVPRCVRPSGYGGNPRGQGPASHFPGKLSQSLRLLPGIDIAPRKNRQNGEWRIVSFLADGRKQEGSEAGIECGNCGSVRHDVPPHGSEMFPLHAVTTVRQWARSQRRDAKAWTACCRYAVAQIICRCKSLLAPTCGSSNGARTERRPRPGPRRGEENLALDA
jgi:hypothetical protein